MGIPYSKEINKAFVELNNAYGQVTPLVAAAYEVLETTKNISLMVAGIQVLNAFLLASILLCMVALLITTNPDMEKERKQLVTPAVAWIAGWTVIGKKLVTTLVTILVILAIGGVVFIQRDSKGGPVEAIEAEESGVEEKREEVEETDTGNEPEDAKK
jgi:hypothetical protein